MLHPILGALPAIAVATGTRAVLLHPGSGLPILGCRTVQRLGSTHNRGKIEDRHVHHLFGVACQDVFNQLGMLWCNRGGHKAECLVCFVCLSPCHVGWSCVVHRGRNELPAQGAGDVHEAAAACTRCL